MENLKSKRYLTRKEAAELLKVTPQTISNYIKRGLLIEAGGDGAANTKRILTSSVATLLDDGYDIIEHARSMEEFKSEILNQKRQLNEERKALDAAFELIRAKDHYLKNLKKVTETLSAYLAKEEGLTQREQRIMIDLILNRPEEYMVKKYDIKQERIRQIFNKCLRLISLKGESRYDSIKEENRRLSLQNEAIEKTIQVLQDKINQLEKELNLKKETVRQNTSSGNPDIVRIPASLTGLNGISNRLYHILSVLDISHIYEIALLSRHRFIKTRNLGRKSFRETENLLERHGLTFSLESLLNVCNNSTETEYIEVPISVLLEKNKIYGK